MKRLSWFQWQYQPEHRAAAAGILAAEIAAMCAGVAASNRQAEARAAGISCSTMIKPHQALEDAFALGWGDTWSRIPDFSNRKLIMLAYHYMHLALRAGRSYCVVDHVAQDAADFGRVSMGDYLRPAHCHDRLRMQQRYPIDLVARQGAN
jgi:hypothetical protein